MLILIVRRGSEMKGAFVEVVSPLTREVLNPYLKNWPFWGKVDHEIEKTLSDSNDLVGFVVKVKTKHGIHEYRFEKITDSQGFYHWKEIVVCDKQ